MKLIPTEQASVEKVNVFLEKNQDINRELLFQIGYVAEVNDRISGCFMLDTMEEGVYWLKQLYITPDAATSLPALLESVLALAKQKHAKQVYVHSHQPMVDVLLEALQFHPQRSNNIVDNYPRNRGSWWMYNVS
ncbi:GNAT family N-acetyltransferase [Virgibacillus byunsanensis]|uniref:GNAT family N-acetyltransferase n=1 Tax=Virgibacillus byunsanensis TaxID=570945 RepID=A0ABW3LFQ8_9BACI